MDNINTDSENIINENIHKYVEKKHIEIENNIKLMKDTMTDLTAKNNEDYIEVYNNILNNNKILQTDTLINIFGNNIKESINEDNNLQTQLENIDNIRKNITNRFIYKFNLCSEYIRYYNDTKTENNELHKMYNKNIIELVEKNKEYNHMIESLLEEYNNKFNEYKHKIRLDYPKNYLVQLIVNMIILQDNRNKTNIKFKQALINELDMQKKELNDQINLLTKINLNSTIMNECYNINNTVDNINNIINNNDNNK